MMNKQKKRAISEGKFDRVADNCGNDRVQTKFIDGKIISIVVADKFMYWMEESFAHDEEGFMLVERDPRYFRKHLSECI